MLRGAKTRGVFLHKRNYSDQGDGAATRTTMKSSAITVFFNFSHMHENEFKLWTTVCFRKELKTPFHLIFSHSTGDFSQLHWRDCPWKKFPSLSFCVRLRLVLKSHRVCPPTADAFIRPRCHPKLVTVNVQTLMCIGQRMCLARRMKTLVINVCWV